MGAKNVVFKVKLNAFTFAYLLSNNLYNLVVGFDSRR